MSSVWDASLVFQQIYIGSLGAAVNQEAISANHVSHVLTVAGQLEVHTALDVRHLQIDISDHPNADILSVLQTALSFIDSALESSESNILIHCASGISRSVSVCCAWLMTRQSLSYDSAIAHVRLARSCASPNIGFQSQLLVLQETVGDVPRARKLYLSRGAGSDISTIISSQRETALDLHTQVDVVENEFKKAQAHGADWTVDTNAAIRVDWLRKLQSAQTNLDLLSASMSNSIADRGAAMVRKSAASKAQRLIDEMKN